MPWINHAPLESRNIWLASFQCGGYFRLAQTLTFALRGQLTNQPPRLKLSLDHLGETRIHRRSPRDEGVQATEGWSSPLARVGAQPTAKAGVERETGVVVPGTTNPVEFVYRLAKRRAR